MPDLQEIITACYDSTNLRLRISVLSGATTLTDDSLYKVGTDGDTAFLNRSTVLNANTLLASVLIGTPVSQAIAANSYMLSNTTASGDLALYVNKGGHSQMVFLAQGASGDTAILVASGASFDVYVAGTKVLDYATGAFAFQQSVTISSSGTLTLTTPVLGVATATSINKVTITQPATSATLTIANTGSLITVGAYSITLTATNTTSITLPTTGTLATLAGAETFTAKLGYNGLVVTANTGAITTGSWTATVISPVYGGTGIANNVASTLTITGAYATTLTVTAATGVTLPTTGTLVSSVTTGNGVSATNTAGALAFTLGVIAPTSVNGLTFAAAANGFTIAGGTTSKTLTVPLDASVSGTNTGDNTVATSGDSATAFFASGVLEVAIGGTGVTSSTGTVAVVLSNTPTLVTPILGVASATSLATSAAIPLLLTYGQLVNISLTSQTVGATTLTIPNFASVSDTFAFITLSQTLVNKTLTSPTINGTIGTTGLTMPAFTLGGTVTGGSQVINSLGHIGIGVDSHVQISLRNVETYTQPVNDKVGVYSDIGVSDISAANANAVRAFESYARLLAANTKNWTLAPVSFKGLSAGFQTAVGATGTVTGAAGATFFSTINAATVTNLYGAYFINADGAGTVTNQYGIYIEDMTKGATLDIGVAIAGADTACLWLGSGADNTGAPDGIFWGASRDTDLYRSAANVLKTDDLFDAALGFQVAGVPGDDESGSGTITTFTITIVKGIVTAFAKVS